VGETRSTFDGLGTIALVVWYSLSFLSTAIFFWGVVRLAQKARRGSGGARSPATPLARRISRALRVTLTHAWIRRRAGVTGLAHACVFYGFLVLFAGTLILALDDHVAKPLGIGFWHGAFYLGYSLLLDAFGFALVVGLVVLAGRRAIVRPVRLRYSSDRYRYAAGDWLLILSLLFLAVSGFALEGLRIAAGAASFERWAPFGWLLGKGLQHAGLSPAAADDTRLVFWWSHGVAALVFVAAIPFTKGVHMLVGPASVASHDPVDAKRLTNVPDDAPDGRAGYRRLEDFAPRHLLQLDACTRCGKCHEACPATAVGAPLSPRDLILDLARLDLVDIAVGGDNITADTLWACTQCGACVEICPVGIEHVPIIAQLRRGLVEEGEVEQMVQPVLEAVHRTGNSFGQPKRKRALWSKELAVPLKDARTEPVEWLWYVGDFASFDPRNQKVTVALAKVLQRAGVDVGILYDDERTAGHDIRRIGEEGLFQQLTEQNVETIGECSYERILTSDPHTFNTLRNEYPSLGAPWVAEQVVHHSQLLRDLLAGRALRPDHALSGACTFHDPCALGRYNGEYDAPRDVIAAVGLDLVEMPRNRDNSFCCGAGGGRIWMKELKAAGCSRPSEQRIEEAVSLEGVELFVVACPKDVTMYEDAIKTTGNGARIRLREIAELVHDTMETPEKGG
jgi:Fe-S oxidoreductase/nitrate reductase gamma subunit